MVITAAAIQIFISIQFVTIEWEWVFLYPMNVTRIVFNVHVWKWLQIHLRELYRSCERTSGRYIRVARFCIYFSYIRTITGCFTKNYQYFIVEQRLYAVYFTRTHFNSRRLFNEALAMLQSLDEDRAEKSSRPNEELRWRPYKIGEPKKILSIPI